MPAIPPEKAAVDDADRFRLLGKYRTPRVRVGRFVRCLVRGEIQVVGFTDAPIPWPRGKTTRRPALIVYGDLAKAIRRESAQAVAHWWGVQPLQVWVWRKALGVRATTAGTSRLRSEYTKEPWAVEAWASRHAGAGEARQRRKIAAARRGKPRPPHVVEAVRKAHLGTRHGEETRRRMSEAHRRRGTWPPAAGEPWTAAEDALLGTMPDKEVARRTGRTPGAVQCRRVGLDIPSPTAGARGRQTGR
jgi:hypothetical protein